MTHALLQASNASMLRMVFLAVFFLLLLAKPGITADMAVEVSLTSRDDLVTVSIRNRSATHAIIKDAGIILDDTSYALLHTETSLSPGAELTNSIQIRYPATPGSYPLLATVAYANEEIIVTMRHVGRFYFRQQAQLPESCQLENITLTGKKSGQIVLRSARPEIWRLVLPAEITVVNEQVLPGRKVFTVQSTIDKLTNTYGYFAVAEDEDNGLHRTAVQLGTIRLLPASAAADKGRIATPLLLALFALFAGISFFLPACQPSAHFLTLYKYTSRLLLLTASYLLLKNGDAIIAAVLAQTDASLVRLFGNGLISHLNGANYRYFFIYFIDVYFLGCLLLLYPYLYRNERHIPLPDDKYASLMLSLRSLGSVLRGGRFQWSYTSRLGLLTWLVKLFFLPLLVSWVINNSFHQVALSKSFVFTFAALNAWLLALFIYLDTAIFCFGYAFEFKSLKNEIKSVEPTLLGWLVCLWCYPPFNSFSFRMFDHKLVDISVTWPATVLVVMTGLITVLWGVFAWASVALGWKASNLTNRGIVAHGPYRYVRHPAYASKLLVFYIQGFFLGQYFLGLMIGLTIIYLLRALTEEWHLSLDPDYVAYKQQVKWRFIPGVI